ncbi:Inositol phospholipid synthesis and fat-storage-inducing TM [Nakaseomyces glabratus]|mgnify:CR=1 FL=1
MQTESVYRWVLLGICPTILILGNIIYIAYLDGPIAVNKDGFVNRILVKRGWFWTTIIGWLCILRYDAKRQWKSSLKRYLILTLWWYVFTQGILWFDIPPIMDLIFKYSGGSCNFDIYDSDGNVNLKFQDSWRRRIKSWRMIYDKVKDYQKNGKNPLAVDSKLMDFVTGSIEKAIEHYSYHIKSNIMIKEISRLLSDLNITYSTEQINDFIKNFISNTTVGNSSGANSTLDNSFACRINGGYWQGGHDPSGHIFLLTLMILFLVGESKQFIVGAVMRVVDTRKYVMDKIKKICNEPMTNASVYERRVHKLMRCVSFSASYILWENPVILLLLLLAIWVWNFVITVIVFHTLTEQLSGLFFAYVVGALLYYDY